MAALRGLLLCWALVALALAGFLSQQRQQPSEARLRAWVVLEAERGYLYQGFAGSDVSRQMTALPMQIDFGTQVRWSPDGEWLAFIDYSLHIIRRDGSEIRRLSETFDGGATWSPDGQLLVYSAYVQAEGQNDIFSVSLDDGAQPQRITTSPALDALPLWSPDGARLAYVSDGALFTMTADGSEVQQISGRSPPVVEVVWKSAELLHYRRHGGMVYSLNLADNSASVVSPKPAQLAAPPAPRFELPWRPGLVLISSLLVVGTSVLLKKVRI